MSVPEIVAIAAVARNGVIGADADIPWRIPEDWARFKRLTMGQTLIMGRKTFDSIGRALPGRRTVVITRDPDWHAGNPAADWVEVAAGVDEALELAAQHGSATVWVAGGGQVYRAVWDRLTGLEVTEVDEAPPGDVTFPDIDPAAWVEVAREPGPGCAFVTYARRNAGPLICGP